MPATTLFLAVLVAQDPCFQPAVTLPLPGATQSGAVAAGDLNGDGIADLVAAASPGDVRVLLGTGTGWMTGPPIAAGSQVNDLALGDVDGDGELDLAVADLGGGVAHVLLGDGAGGFPTSVPLPSSATSPSPYSIALADFDSDGVLDVTAVNYFDAASGLETWRGLGGGSFAASQTYATGVHPNGLAVAHLDLDGHLDCIVSTRGSQRVETFLGSATGTLSAPVTVSVASPPIGIAAADLDGDGIADVVVTQPDNDEVLLLVGDGFGGFLSPPATCKTGAFPEAVTLADLDTDGVLDITTANGMSDDVSVLRGIGGGSFAAHQTHAVGTNPTDLVALDLNADGYLDLAAANLQSADVSVLLAGCLPIITAVTPTSAQSPGVITVTGEYLDKVTSALIAGQPAAIVAQSPTSLDLQPSPSDPGFPALDLLSPKGQASNSIEMWPSLTSSLNPGTLDVELDQGAAGTWFLAFSGSLLPDPIPIGWPASAYGLLLAPPLAIAGSGVTVTPDPVALTFAIPPLPSLSGATVCVQGWMAECYFPFDCPASFTNADCLVLP